MKPTNRITVEGSWTISRSKPPLWTMIEVFKLKARSEWEKLFELLLISVFSYKQFNIYVQNNSVVHCVCLGFGHELETQSDELNEWSLMCESNAKKVFQTDIYNHFVSQAKRLWIVIRRHVFGIFGTSWFTICLKFLLIQFYGAIYTYIFPWKRKK